jgi:hypothetical protein
MHIQTFKTGRQAIEALPRSLKVGPFDFGIDKLSAQRALGKDCFGEFSLCEGQIALQLDMPSPIKAADTLLHEAGHAIYATYALAEDDKEERIVAVFAAAWAQVFRDNPWLLAWLAGALSGKVVTGFPLESATNQKNRSAFRSSRIGKHSRSLP